jgi:hypothetical protein
MTTAQPAGTTLRVADDQEPAVSVRPEDPGPSHGPAQAPPADTTDSPAATSFCAAAVVFGAAVLALTFRKATRANPARTKRACQATTLSSPHRKYRR